MKQAVDYVAVYATLYKGKWLLDVSIFRGEKSRAYYNVTKSSLVRVRKAQENLIKEV